MIAKFSWKFRPFPVQGVARLFEGSLQPALKTCCVVLVLLMVPLAHAAKVEDFMPKESVLYVKLQDIDEVYGEIEISENWEKALALLPNLPDWQEMEQGLAMLQGVLGTNPLGIIETVGYRTAFAIWADASGDQQVGVVIHSGGNLGTLQQLTNIVEGLFGMDAANTLRLDAGVYQRVRYNALERFNAIVKYGVVDDFLVIGAGDGSFEKLMDTYRTDLPSVEQNPEFAEALEKIGAGEVTVFANVPPILPVVGLAAWERRNLATFQSMFGRLNLLETGAFLQITAQFTPNPPENEIGLFLKEGQALETLNAVSDADDLFVAVAPKVTESLWKFVPTDAAAERAISFFEALLNLDLEEDIRVGLTSELALSVPDLTRFDSEALSGFRFTLDGAIELDTGDVQTDGGLIFNPSNRMKWNLIGNSLSNLQSTSVSQTEYKGTTVSEVAANIYYSDIDGLFLVGFSEEYIYQLIDGIQQKKKPSYLKQAPKTPTAFAQLNLARALEMKNGSPPPNQLIVDAKEVPLLLTWLSVEDDTVLLEATLSEKETHIEMLAKLVPFLLWKMDVQSEQSD